jgi:hypothetical protein
MNLLPLDILVIGPPEAQRSPMARQLLYLRGHSLKERRPEHIVRCALCGGDATEWGVNERSFWFWPFGVQVMDPQLARGAYRIFTEESTTALAPLGRDDVHLAFPCPRCFARMLSELAPREQESRKDRP